MGEKRNMTTLQESFGKKCQLKRFGEKYIGTLEPHPGGAFFQIEGSEGGYFLPGTSSHIWGSIGYHVTLLE